MEWLASGSVIANWVTIGGLSALSWITTPGSPTVDPCPIDRAPPGSRKQVTGPAISCFSPATVILRLDASEPATGPLALQLASNVAIAAVAASVTGTFLFIVHLKIGFIDGSQTNLLRLKGLIASHDASKPSQAN